VTEFDALSSERRRRAPVDLVVSVALRDAFERMRREGARGNRGRRDGALVAAREPARDARPRRFSESLDADSVECARVRALDGALATPAAKNFFACPHP